MLWFGTVVIGVALAFGFSCSIIGGGIGSMALVEGTLLLASVLDAGEVFVGGAWSALEVVVGLGAAATAVSRWWRAYSRFWAHQRSSYSHWSPSERGCDPSEV